MNERVSYTKLFLPAGLLLLVAGCWGIANYLRLHGPSDEELHEVALRDVSKVTEEPEIPGSTRIGVIWLETGNNERIGYHNRFPHSEEVRHLDTNLSLLLDRSNKVWAVKKAGGAVLARHYFEVLNIEAKSVGQICGPFLAVLGAFLLALYCSVERNWKRWSLAERAKFEVDAHQMRIVLGILGYLIVYALLAHWVLLKLLPGIVVSIGWGISGLLFMRLLSKKKQPPIS